MPIFINTIFDQERLLIPELRLLRHQDRRVDKGRTPYQLWRTDRPAFDLYQSHQNFASRAKLCTPYWASFVGTPEGETVFVGVYSVRHRGRLEQDTVMPHTGAIQKAGTCDVYDLTLDRRLADFEGRLLIDWGSAPRTWIQRADTQNKRIVEIRRSNIEPEFPGFSSFIESLSRIERLPLRWSDALRASRGIYLLACPKTKEQYVGSAIGEDGFLGRWLSYVRSGHGGNIGLKSRDPSDYQVSILEVVGNTVSEGEILELERRWKRKLLSREMGLNRN